MRIDAKARIAIAVTFVLGAAIGAFGAAEVLRPRGPGPDGGAPPGELPRFVIDMERYLQLRDSVQRHAMRPLLLGSDSVNRATVQRAEEAMRDQLKRLRTDASPLLDAQQLQRLDRFIEDRAVNRRPRPRLGPGNPF